MSATSRPRTLFAKIWDAHAIRREPGGETLLWIDRHLVHEGSRVAFERLAAGDLPVHRPDLTVGIADHYVPTDATHRRDVVQPRVAEMIDLFDRHMARHGVRAFGLGHPDQGIVHVVGPELGLTLPGLIVVCGDSHTSTHGALGALGFGIGASEVAHVLATQTLWQKPPKTMRVTITGALAPRVTAKDVALALIARLGANGAQGHVVEYAGPTVAALSVEARLTLCNMTIEAGGRAGMVAPDDVTFAWLAGRRFAPAGAGFDRAMAAWAGLASDPGARFDREVAFEAGQLAPMVTWGTSPESAVAIDGQVPDPDRLADPARRREVADQLAYMGLTPGTPITAIPVDRVFIGSCTNARIEDLRAAAAMLRGRRVAVPTLVSPGSLAVKRQAEAEGLDRLFTDAGVAWRGSGCSLCVGLNGEAVPPGERCAATSNRNFQGRQGPGARTHLVSPAMAAAAAVAGHFVDVRTFG
jgi:3-isopropylmalate/(R)-2-methylmalate dehydratase large subunit